jgi:hypothetical protein
LFLTTLGVYLGLLVVGGAAPQVLAHSATTRNFEITDEIEVKDDLDKKPDDERSPVHMSLGNYSDAENSSRHLGVSSGNYSIRLRIHFRSARAISFRASLGIVLAVTCKGIRYKRRGDPQVPRMV